MKHDRVKHILDIQSSQSREYRAQTEEDADKEIENMKVKFENRLQNERDATLRLHGQCSIDLLGPNVHMYVDAMSFCDSYAQFPHMWCMWRR